MKSHAGLEVILPTNLDFGTSILNAATEPLLVQFAASRLPSSVHTVLFFVVQRAAVTQAKWCVTVNGFVAG